MKKNGLLITVTLCFMATSCFAVSGAQVLSQTVGARAMGMGEAFTAVSDDVNAVYWNPAGLAGLKKSEFSAMYLQGLVDNTYTSASIGVPSNNVVYGVGVSMFDGGSMDLNVNGVDSTVKAISDYVGVFSLAKKDFMRGQSSTWDLGVSAKLLSSTMIEKYSASSYAVDLGVMSKSDKITYGAVVQNIGTGIKYLEEVDPLPMTIRLGGAYNVQDTYLSKVTVSGEVVRPNDEDMKIHLGLEYWYAKLIAFRVGFKNGYTLESYTAGIGLNVTGYQIDMGFGPMGVLGNVSKLSFTARF